MPPASAAGASTASARPGRRRRCGGPTASRRREGRSRSPPDGTPSRAPARPRPPQVATGFAKDRQSLPHASPEVRDLPDAGDREDRRNDEEHERIPAPPRGLWKTQNQSMPGQIREHARPGSTPAESAQVRSSTPTTESKIVSASRLEARVGTTSLDPVPRDVEAQQISPAPGQQRVRAGRAR